MGRAGKANSYISFLDENQCIIFNLAVGDQPDVSLIFKVAHACGLASKKPSKVHVSVLGKRLLRGNDLHHNFHNCPRDLRESKPYPALGGNGDLVLTATSCST